MRKKYPLADLKLSYPLIMESGVIIALSILIVIAKMEIKELPRGVVTYVKGDETALVLPPTISESQTMLEAPDIPVVPIKLPNDEAIELEPLEMDEYDRTSRLVIPPLPEEVTVEVDYELFKDIEQLPVMIGGEEAFRKSIEYPRMALRSNIEGIVEVEFTVNEYGRVLNPVIVKGIGYGCDKEVLKAILMQRYKPGKKIGQNASFKIKETVQFIILNS